MNSPGIICIAITGSLPTKNNNPGVPITISEQIESTHEAFLAEAIIAHCHVRDDEGKPTSNPDRFARLKEGLEEHCLGMIVQLSNGVRAGAGRDRGGMLPLWPDMASLSVGSNNFATRVYENSPDLVDWLASEMITHDVKPEIEAFDLRHIVQATKMAADGRLKAPLFVQFVMGVKNSMPADERIFDFCIETLKRLAPDAQWCAAGIGAAQRTINEWAIATGGHLPAGGAGIPGFYTKTGVGTVIAEGKEVKQRGKTMGRPSLSPRGRKLFADLSIVKAWKADETGNLVFRKTARNFNPPAAM